MRLSDWFPFKDRGGSSSTHRPRRLGAARAVERGVTSFAKVLIAFLVVVGIWFASGATATWESFLVVSGLLIALEGAAVVLGVLAGLLFGMPREIDVSGDAKPEIRFLANTGLLRVSDWLTTVIVGLSLVSLRQIPGALTDFGDWMKPALGGSESSAEFIVLFAVAGFGGAFILMFLWTTVTLRGHLEDQAREFTWRLTDEAILVESGELNIEQFEQTLGEAPYESIAYLKLGGLAGTSAAVRRAIVDEWNRRRQGGREKEPSSNAASRTIPASEEQSGVRDPDALDSQDSTS